MDEIVEVRMRRGGKGEWQEDGGEKKVGEAW